jgi:hypothetical protein
MALSAKTLDKLTRINQEIAARYGTKALRVVVVESYRGAPAFYFEGDAVADIGVAATRGGTPRVGISLNASNSVDRFLHRADATVTDWRNRQDRALNELRHAAPGHPTEVENCPTCEQEAETRLRAELSQTQYAQATVEQLTSLRETFERAARDVEYVIDQFKSDPARTSYGAFMKYSAGEHAAETALGIIKVVVWSTRPELIYKYAQRHDRHVADVYAQREAAKRATNEAQ